MLVEHARGAATQRQRRDARDGDGERAGVHLGHAGFPFGVDSDLLAVGSHHHHLGLHRVHVVVLQRGVGPALGGGGDEVGAEAAVLDVDVHAVGPGEAREDLHGAAGFDGREPFEYRVVGVPVLDLARLQVEGALRGRADDAAVLGEPRVLESLGERTLRRGPGLDGDHGVFVPEQEHRLAERGDLLACAPRESVGVADLGEAARDGGESLSGGRGGLGLGLGANDEGDGAGLPLAERGGLSGGNLAGGGRAEGGVRGGALRGAGTRGSADDGRGGDGERGHFVGVCVDSSACRVDAVDCGGRGGRELRVPSVAEEARMRFSQGNEGSTGGHVGKVEKNCG